MAEVNIKEYRITVDNNVTIKNEGETYQPLSNRQQALPSNNEIPTNTNKMNGVGRAIAINMASKAGAYITSNYGNLTGDYLMQAKINEGTELLGLGAMALSGPVGIAAVIGTVGVKLANRYIDVAKSENASKAIRERVGLSTGGSR